MVSAGPMGYRRDSLIDTEKKIGRPKKSKAQENLPSKPRSDRSIMEAYRQRLLNSPSSEKVIRKVFQTALDDEHTHQAACMKMIMDRVLPATGFSEVVSGGQQRQSIQINISGLQSVEVNSQGSEPDAEDAVFTPVVDNG
jgi:hypothetical protein|tara:strand:- start:3307 stop:3726 length:420 start_codon:yes stop_codon:yes gene_type:complete